MSRAGSIVKRTLVSFYDDQMTHHAAALTYYSLMSLFPALLLALSLLGLLGQYPETYDAILNYLRDVAPESVVAPLDDSLRTALQSKGTAATTLAISVVIAFYGATGVLEAARRALNVVFEVESGRSFLSRKLTDVALTVVLMVLVLVTLIMVLVGGRVRRGPAGVYRVRLDRRRDLEHRALARRRCAVAMLVFSFIYYVTPDVKQRSFRWVAPGGGGRRCAVAERVVRPVDLHLERSPTSVPPTVPSRPRSCSWGGYG